MGRWAQRFATTTKRPLVAYATALGAVGAAVLLRLAAGLVIPAPPNFMLFYPAVLFATLVAGARGGLLASGLSAIAVTLLWTGLGDVTPVLMFAVTAAATVFIGRAIRLAVLRGLAAEERFAIFQHQPMDGLMVLEPIGSGGEITDFRWTYANPTAERMASAATSDLVGKRLLDVFPNQVGRDMLRRFAAVLRDGAPDEMEMRHLVDGQELYLRSSAMRADGRVTVALRDVTAQRTSENALRAGEAQIRALVDSLPQLIWSCRSDGHCDYLSPQWLAFTGLPAEQHYGDGWLDAVHPEDRDAAAEAWSQAVAGGLPYNIDYRLRRRDGVWRWVSARASAVRNDNGEVRRWFGTSSDVTEIVEAREDLETRFAERSQALERSLA
ncbi:MAG TPA: PAS domain-containing protein, partial [Phenylobacterium sp.]